MISVAASSLPVGSLAPIAPPTCRPRTVQVVSPHASLSAHDAQYVALAEALKCRLITADARINRSGVAHCEVEVSASTG